MTIQEQLIKLNSKFDQLHQDFSSAEMQQKSLDSKYTGIINSIRSKWQIEYDKQNQLKEEILKYYRIAKDNSKKELVHSGIAPQRPDLAKLNSLIERINVNNRMDPVAGQIIDLTSAYVAYVDKEIAQISQKEQSEIANANRNKGDEQKNLTQRKKQILMKKLKRNLQQKKQLQKRLLKKKLRKNRQQRKQLQLLKNKVNSILIEV